MQITYRHSPRHIESLAFRLSVDRIVSILLFDLSNYLELKISKSFDRFIPFYFILSLGLEKFSKKIQSNNILPLLIRRYETHRWQSGKGKFPGARVIWLREDRSRMRHQVATLCKLSGAGKRMQTKFPDHRSNRIEQRSCKILKQGSWTELTKNFTYRYCYYFRSRFPRRIF